VTEPEATFSACFGGAFLMWHPMKYASMLAEKMGQHGTTAWLVNTGCAWGRVQGRIQGGFLARRTACATHHGPCGTRLGGCEGPVCTCSGRARCGARGRGAWGAGLACDARNA